MNDKMLAELSHEELAKQLLADSSVWASTTSDFRLLAATQAQAHATLALLEEIRSQNTKISFSNWKDRSGVSN